MARPTGWLHTTALVAYLVFSLPHLVFHLNHLEPFVTVDAVAQVVTLAVAAGLPVPLLVLARRTHAPTAGPGRRGPTPTIPPAMPLPGDVPDRPGLDHRG